MIDCVLCHCLSQREHISPDWGGLSLSFPPPAGREEAEDQVGRDGKAHAKPGPAGLDEQVEDGVKGHGQGQQPKDACIEQLLLKL